jgi:hypothetical protein
LSGSPDSNWWAGEIALGAPNTIKRSPSFSATPLLPPLKGEASLQPNDPTTVMQIVLEGTRSVPTPGKPTPLAMPAFAPHH